MADHSRECKNNTQQHEKIAVLRGSFTDEEKRNKDRQEALFDHTRTLVCSAEHYVSFQEFSRLLGTQRGRDSS